MLVTDWAADQIVDNAASVRIGSKTLQFIRMPDGTYVSPAGLAAVLIREAGGDFVLTERHDNAYRFDADHDNRLQSITDPHGNELTVAYKTDGKIDVVEDAFGRRLTFSYDDDRINGVSDSTGRAVSYAYDGHGNLVSATDPEGDTVHYHYHDADTGPDFAEKHLLVAVENGEGQVTIRNFYDSLDRVVRQHGDDDPEREYKLYFNGRENIEENPLGGMKRYYFSKDFRDLGEADELGNRVVKAYDGQDHLVGATLPGGATVEAEYDVHHNLVRRALPGDLEEVYAHDALHRTTERRLRDLSGTAPDRVQTYTFNPGNDTNQLDAVTDAEGNRTEFAYNTDGTLHTATAVSDDGNLTTTRTYDSYGMPETIEHPDGTTESFDYNERGDRLSHMNQRGNTTTHQYNSRRQRTRTTAPDGSVTLRTYDTAGNLETVTRPEGDVIRYTYSPQGKLLTETVAYGTADAATTTHEYDHHDRQVRTIDPLGRVTHFEYDAAGRLVKTVDPLDRETAYTYDADGNRTSVTTPEGIVTQFAYNPRGEQTSMTDPVGNALSHVRNTFGERTSLVNRRGNAYTFAYDQNGDLVTLVTPLGHTTTRTWNDRGLLESLAEPSGDTTTFEYNSMGRVRKKTDLLGETTYHYFNNGLPMWVFDENGGVGRNYDARDRIRVHQTADDTRIVYDYDGNGNLAELTYYPDTTYTDGRTVTYTYDALDRLATVTDWDGRVTLFHWDAAGRLTGIDRPNGTYRENRYSDADELERFYEHGLGDQGLLAYARLGYDDDSRVEWRYRLPKPEPFTPPTFEATYDIDNRLATWKGNAVDHDQDGNMTFGPLPNTDDFAAYTYDVRNRLVSAGGVSYQYDAEGTRTAVTDQTGTTRYVVETNTGLSKVLVRIRPDGTETYYVYGAGRLLYEVDESGSAAYYHFDQVGSTIALTDDNGAVTDRVEYCPFGAVTHREGDTDTPFLFNGAYGVMTDSNGLLHMRARYYNPTLRRFVNADPSASKAAPTGTPSPTTTR